MDSYNMGYETETIYKSLRGTLDELGYHQALSFDSLYLVKALVADLIKTTQSLKHYKELAQKTLDTCSELEVGIHPYKEDNARLQKECNQLHKKLIAQKDRHEDIQKDLKAKLRRCELEKDELEFRNGELSAKLCDVEKECLKKNERILELQNVILKRHPHRNNSATKLNIGKGDQGSFETKLKSSTSLDSTVSLLKEADAKTKVLRNEVKHLTQKLEERRYVIESLEAKINSRDLEIHRLSSLLEGGRPVSAVIQDHGVAKASQIQMFCTCKKDCHFAGLERANLKLERKLKECLRRQHDAMLHALRLSEKNKLLESRLQNKEDKKESEKNHKDMIELQEKINSLTKLIEALKKENQTNMKTIKSKTTSFSSKETISYSELKEKVEDYKIMEKDFMKELDRLERENSLQKSYIADLEKKLLACMSSKEEVERKSKLLQSHINENKDASKTSETQAAQVSFSTPHSNPPQKKNQSKSRRKLMEPSKTCKRKLDTSQAAKKCKTNERPFNNQQKLEGNEPVQKANLKPRSKCTKNLPFKRSYLETKNPTIPSEKESKNPTTHIERENENPSDHIKKESLSQGNNEALSIINLYRNKNQKISHESDDSDENLMNDIITKRFIDKNSMRTEPNANRQYHSRDFTDYKSKSTSDEFNKECKTYQFTTDTIENTLSTKENNENSPSSLINPSQFIKFCRESSERKLSKSINCEHVLSQIQERLSAVNAFQNEKYEKRHARRDWLKEFADKSTSMYEILRRTDKQIQTEKTELNKVKKDKANLSTQKSPEIICQKADIVPVTTIPDRTQKSPSPVNKELSTIKRNPTNFIKENIRHVRKAPHGLNNNGKIPAKISGFKQNCTKSEMKHLQKGKHESNERTSDRIIKSFSNKREKQQTFHSKGLERTGVKLAFNSKCSKIHDVNSTREEGQVINIEADTLVVRYGDNVISDIDANLNVVIQPNSPEMAFDKMCWEDGQFYSYFTDLENYVALDFVSSKSRMMKPDILASSDSTVDCNGLFM